MKMFLLGLIILLAALASKPIYAANYDIRDWANDSKLFFSQVLDPVREQLHERGCVEKVDLYLGPLFSQLRTIKATVSAKSYLLFREIILNAGEDLASFEESLNCKILDRWSFLENHIRNKIELIGNTFLILE